MLAVEVVSEVRRRGISLVDDEDRLRIRPASALTPELKTELKEHKNEILEILANEHPLPCPCQRCSTRAPSYAKIKTTGEVLEMARSYFGPVEDPVTPPAPPGRDPLVQREEHGGPAGDKVKFFRGDWREAWPEDFAVHRPDGAE